MNQTLTVGLQHTIKYLVKSHHLATHVESGSVNVLSTPSLVAFCEACTRSSIAPFLEEGFSTVGTYIEIQHLAPTPEGSTVSVFSTLTRVNDKEMTFSIEVFDDVELIGSATHRRFIIDDKRFSHRISKKQQY